MANYVEIARSNYFHVKSVEAFKAFMNAFHGITVIDNGSGQVGFYSQEGIPGWMCDNGDGEETEIDFLHELSLHLQDGEVAIVTASGSEAMRYVSGYAVAVNNKGESRAVNIDAIYGLARELTNRPDDITRAEY